MFSVVMTEEVCGSHRLELPYESKCSNIHGHNWKIKVCVQSPVLTPYGMVVDFCDLKKIVRQLDHVHLNDVIDSAKIGNPTAENIAWWVAMKVAAAIEKPASVKWVEVEESEGNVARYENYGGGKPLPGTE